MTNPLFLSLMVGAFVGGAAGYLGSLMVTRKMALVGDALGHVALRLPTGKERRAT
jgi:ABC-type Mn2+/Zn2+ transport system permease subunit